MPQLSAFCGHPPGAAWSPAELAAGYAMWLAMIAGMMGPVVLPWVVALGRRDGPGLGRPARMGLFLAGYAAAWAGSGLAALLLQWGLAAGGVLSAQRFLAHPWAAGAAVAAVGAYQFSPLKGSCLKHCQTPASFLLAHWRDGAWGAAWMGARHGVHCVGCCWPLMALALVAGAMSLPWMAGLTVFALAEMYLPRPAVLTRLAGAGLIGLGVLIPVLARAALW